MDETDLAGARDGFRAGAAGVAIGTGIALAAWALSALIGDGAFPGYLLGPLLMPASSFVAPLWRERRGHRRPATLVALALCLPVMVAALAVGDLLAEDPDHGPTGWSGVLYLVMLLLSTTVFGALAGPPGAEPGRSWLRFTGRGRRYHLAVYGSLAAAFALALGLAAAAG
ncbi:hypothetical protein Kpho02_28560 [Kitasatospora phosalacinea]|uniref:Uncharacterized protein n=1 Tax=Kitasatospora phosalacinea TaxID=2065 RepID=A0A9W6Q9L1_9ACTN|nr:hypothetical protein [Kitasatospora phosalacinea]GLW70557.1 hypothetical protein Kpho02_28560 [Kitasatospora phosalacinea]